MYIESYTRKSEQGYIKVLNIMEKEKEVYSYRDEITLCVIVSHEELLFYVSTSKVTKIYFLSFSNLELSVCAPVNF